MAAELDGWGNEIAEEAVAPEEIVQDTEGVVPVAEGEVAPLAEGEAPLTEEDPDAWRVRRFDEDSGSVHKHLLELEEKSPAFKRALNSIAATRARKELQDQVVSATERAEAAEAKARRFEVLAGDEFWGKRTVEQRAQILAQNPSAAQSLANWEALKRQQQAPQQQVPVWVKSLVSDAQAMVDQAAPYLSPEDEAFLRAQVTNPATYAQYKDNPHRLMFDLKESIDSVLNPNNNVGVRTDATPRTPVSANGSTRVRNESLVQVNPSNPTIGRHAPDTTPPRGSSGGNTRYTRQEFEALPVEQLKAMHATHGTKTGQALFRIVGVA